MKLHVTNKKKTTFMIAGIVLLLVIIIVVVSLMRKGKAASTDTVAEEAYQTTPLEKQDVTKEIGLSGTLDSAHSESVSSTLEGVKVKEVCVQVGDTVNEGDVLFRFDSSEIEQKLEAAKKALANEQATKAAEIASNERNYADAQTTQNVEAGRSDQAVNQAADAYNAAVSSKATAESAYQSAVSDRKSQEKAVEKAKEAAANAKKDEKSAKKSLEEAQKSGDEQAIASAQAAYDAAASQKKQADKSLESAQATLASLKAAEAERQSQVTSAGDVVNSASSSLQQAQNDRDDSNRSNAKSVADSKDTLDNARRSSSADSQSGQDVKSYEEQLEQCTVKAASSGVITTVSAKVGDTYNNGVLATIQDEKNYVVTAMVDQYDISDITKDMKALIKTDTTGEEEMNGTVTFVSPVPASVAASSDNSDSSSGSSGNGYEIRITVDNPSERLRIGMTAKVTLIQEEVKNVFAVPDDCISEDEDGNSAIQILENGEPRSITVTTGLKTDYYTEISSDELTEGMNVIIPDVTEMDDMSGMDDSMSYSVY